MCSLVLVFVRQNIGKVLGHNMHGIAQSQWFCLLTEDLTTKTLCTPKTADRCVREDQHGQTARLKEAPTHCLHSQNGSRPVGPSSGSVMVCERGGSLNTH